MSNKKAIKDIAKVTNGKSDVKDAIHNGEYLFFDRSTIIKRSNNYLINSEAIIIAGEDSRQIFEPRYYSGKFNLHQRCYVIYDFEENYYPKYLLYKLKTLTKHFANVNVGSTVPSLRLDHITDLIIDFPSFETQKIITKVLSDLDAKMELNNKINQELEAMAKTLYDYWFVQFDFPNEQGKPYKSSGGKMVYSKELKREIPDGWEVKKLSDWIKKYKNGDWGKETEEGNYTLKVSCVRGADINGLNGIGELNAPIRYILRTNDNKTLLNHDLIIEISGGSPTQSTGRLAFITEETLMRFSNLLICSNFCKAMTLKDEKYFYNFVYIWNRLYDNGVLFGWEGKTSGIKNLLFESFVTHQKEVYPNSEVVEKFYEFAKLIHAKKQMNLFENQKLAELRDWLLPMLMNGQVSVGEAEEQLNIAAEPRIEYYKD
jgi:type I restriction enzyme S subunit